MLLPVFQCHAVVESVLSIVTCVKTKYRNHMSMIVLESFVRVRINIMMKEICCVDFEISSEMLYSMYERENTRPLTNGVNSPREIGLHYTFGQPAPGEFIHKDSYLQRRN